MASNDTEAAKRSNERKSPRHSVASLALASAVVYWLSRVRLDRELQRQPFSIQLSIGERWIVSIPVLPIPFLGAPGNLFSFLPWVGKRAQGTEPADEASGSRQQDGTTRKPRRGVTFATVNSTVTTPAAPRREAKRQAAAAMFMLDKLWSGDSPDPATTPRSGASTPTNTTPGTTPRSFASTPASTGARTPLAQRSPAVAASGAAANKAIQNAADGTGGGIGGKGNGAATPGTTGGGAKGTPAAAASTPKTTTPGSAARFVVRQLGAATSTPVGVGGTSGGGPNTPAAAGSKENSKPLLGWSSTSPLATS